MFDRNHAKVIVAYDFFGVITAAFRILYVFVVTEIVSRQILHHNATAHPTAEWTLQQFREALPATIPTPSSSMIDGIFTEEVGLPEPMSEQDPSRAPTRSACRVPGCEKIRTRRLAS